MMVMVILAWWTFEFFDSLVLSPILRDSLVVRGFVIVFRKLRFNLQIDILRHLRVVFGNIHELPVESGANNTVVGTSKEFYK